MNEERGVDTVINYDAEILEYMTLHPDIILGNPQNTDKNKEEGSDETIIYNASEFDQTTKETVNPEDINDDSEKSPKGQLRTRTFGIIKRKTTMK